MKLRGEAGFTLIETVLGVTVMAIMVTAVGNIFVSNLHTLTLGKARAIGLQAANEQMEYLRDLPYDNVKTTGGSIYPPGNIPDSQTITRGGYTFTLKTEVEYVDDPYDGNAAGTISGKPQDLNPADYKKARISVYLKSSGQNVASLTSDIAGKAAETASNTGVLSVKVLDASGQPVPSATIHIVNTTPNPDVDITTTTDNQGLVVIPNLPPDSSNRYQITASAGGYSTDQTIPDPAGSQTAVNLNPNILVQQITTTTLAIDRIATMNIHLVDTSGANLVGKSVTVTGTKKIKNGPDVYKYSVSNLTNANGLINLTGMEWDAYGFKLPAGLYLASVQPYAPVALQPNGNLNVTLVAASSSTWPTLVSATPTNGSTTTASVTLKLTGTNLPASSTISLQRSGQPNVNATAITSTSGSTVLNGTLNLTGIAPGSWDIVVTAPGGSVQQVGGFTVAP